MATILPDLQASILCEDVRPEISGQQTLVGVINVIPAPMVPIAFFKLCLWTRWCGGAGTFVQRSVILSADDESPIAESQIQFSLDEIEAQATNVHVFGGLKFESLGVFHVEIFLDEDLRLRFPLPVVKVNQPAR